MLGRSTSVAGDLLDFISRGEFELARLAEMIEQDKLFADSVLRLANSPHYRRSDAVTSLKFAVSLLGVWTLRSMAALLLIREIGTLEDRTWNHCLSVAVAAQLHAEIYGDDPALAYSTGLIHDFGAILLANFDPVGYRAIESRLDNGLTRESQSEYIGAEIEAYGISHPDLGSSALERWGFPEETTDAVRLHHRESVWMSPAHRALVSGERLVHLERLSPLLWSREILLPEDVTLSSAIDRLALFSSRVADFVSIAPPSKLELPSSRFH